MQMIINKTKGVFPQKFFFFAASAKELILFFYLSLAPLSCVLVRAFHVPGQYFAKLAISMSSRQNGASVNVCE